MLGWVPILFKDTGVYLLQTALAILPILYLYRKLNDKSARLSLAEQMIKLVQQDADNESKLSQLLEVFSSIVDVSGYALYVQEPGNGRFALKAALHRRQEPGRAEPSYSGLLPYQKEVFKPPLGLKMDDSVRRSGTVRDEAGLLLLQLILEDGKSLLRMGPVTRVPDKQIKLLRYAANLAPRILEAARPDMAEMDGKASV